MCMEQMHEQERTEAEQPINAPMFEEAQTDVPAPFTDISKIEIAVTADDIPTGNMEIDEHAKTEENKDILSDNDEKTDFFKEHTVTDTTDRRMEVAVPDAFLDTTDKEDALPSEQGIDTSPTDNGADAQKKATVRRIDGVFDFVEMFVCMLIAVLLLNVFIFRHAYVNGGSMEMTLQDGDRLIISSLFYTPKDGDIIVFEKADLHSYPLVKRIIATEGETVLLVSDTEVYVDGQRIDGGYTDGVSNYTYPIQCKVPEGHVFVLGDHRNNSKDSRDFGPIPTEYILGKVLIRIYPFDTFGVPETPETKE